MNKKGFTLVELLTIVIILAVISAIIFPILSKTIENNKKKSFEASLNAVVRAAELYKSNNNNNLTPIDYNNSLLDISNKSKWTAGTITQKLDPTDGLTKIYLVGFYDGQYCGNGFEDNFTITKGNCTTTPDFCFVINTSQITSYQDEYSACNSVVVIPNSIDGVNITSIGANAFRDSQISSVTIPSTVTTIGSGAFLKDATTYNVSLNTIINKSSSTFNWFDITSQGTLETCTFSGSGTCGLINITTG